MPFDWKKIMEFISPLDALQSIWFLYDLVNKIKWITTVSVRNGLKSFIEKNLPTKLMMDVIWLMALQTLFRHSRGPDLLGCKSFTTAVHPFSTPVGVLLTIQPPALYLLWSSLTRTTGPLVDACHHCLRICARLSSSSHNCMSSCTHWPYLPELMKKVGPSGCWGLAAASWANNSGAVAKAESSGVGEVLFHPSTEMYISMAVIMV